MASRTDLFGPKLPSRATLGELHDWYAEADPLDLLALLERFAAKVEADAEQIQVLVEGHQEQARVADQNYESWQAAEAMVNAVRDLAQQFVDRLPDGTGNGRLYNSWRVALMISEALGDPDPVPSS